MDISKQNAVAFLEKEIRTYVALSLFLAKYGIPQRRSTAGKRTWLSPAFYKTRIKEAAKIADELRQTN